MRVTGIAVAALLAAVTVASLAGCASGEPSSSGPVRSASSPEVDTMTPTPRQGEPTPVAPAEKNAMRIEIEVNGQRFRATLASSAASRDLLAQLPQTVEMTDHGGVEKTGPLRTPLSLDGQPSGGDPDVGDVGYYAPGNDLVLYYGDQSYFPGIVILGKLEGDGAQRLAEVSGRVTVTVEER